MKRILILGSAGMLGHMVLNYFSENSKYEIINASFPDAIRPDSIVLDVTDKRSVEELVKREAPEIIINCIGILISGSKSDSSNAIYINSYLPHMLAKFQRRNGGKVIQISTDCVFSGSKGNYSEFDLKDATDVYGLSKSLGELHNDFDLTLRTSIIGPELKENGEGLFHWFMNQSGKINGFTEVYWGGVTTLVLAKAILYAIERDLTGLYHVTPGYKISKYDLLHLIGKTWKKNISIIPDNSKRSDKSLINQRKGFDFITGTYEEMLYELYEKMISNKHLYNHYKY